MNIDPDYECGANIVILNKAKENYARTGKAETEEDVVAYEKRQLNRIKGGGCTSNSM